MVVLSPIFWSSYFVLWLLMLIVSTALLLTQQLVLNPRVLSQESHGLPLGTSFPAHDLKSLTGQPLTFSGAQSTVVVLISGGCHACRDLFPALSPFHRNEPSVSLVLLFMGTPEEARAIVQQEDWSFPVATMGPPTLSKLQTRIFPFAYLLTPDGTVVAKGVVNSASHLQLLIQSAHRRKAV